MTDGWASISGGTDTSAVALSEFKVKFPEFEGLGDDPMIQRHLDDAETHIDRGLWGRWADQGVMLWAAHTLSMTPYGQNARMEKKGSKTSVYYQQWHDLVRKVVCGIPR